MSSSPPNILLLMTDQHRGDCLGIEDHPVLQTPYLDHLAASGVRFRHAYTACPVCVPARRTLMTGQRPSTHGVMMNYDTRLDGPTLPGELAKAGYQTHLVGKLHLHPHRARYGFQSADWADGPRSTYTHNDYQLFLRKNGVLPNQSDSHGMDHNGWATRPWNLDERFHFSNWCTDMALEFLTRRDPTCPFFLKVSYIHPHQPCTPPPFYYERYMAMDLPEPYVGDWAKVFDGPVRGLPVDSWRTSLTPAQMKQFRAAYYGSIDHIDSQIGRILDRIPRDTVVLFCSDHGEMLGDHQWIRKRGPYEPSARVPFLVRLPREMGIEQRQVRDEPVELMDVMPTLLEAAGVPIPESVEGRSVLPLIKGAKGAWREYVHGECSEVPSMNSGMHYVTDGRRKYIWFPGAGLEQYFDLEKDPREMHDLAQSAGHKAEIATWRGRLVEELKGRPEQFVRRGKLQKLPGGTPPFMPGFKRA